MSIARKAVDVGSAAEKRKFTRVAFQRELEIFPVFPSYSEDFSDLPLTGQSQDISGGGIAFKANPLLKIGSFLKLRFELEKDQRVEAFGKIVWAKDNFFGFSFYPSSGIPVQQF